MNLKCEKCGSSEKMEVSQVSKRSWWPWIIGGSVLLAGIIGIAVYFWWKRGKKGDKADAS